jgi:hypothetical protein
VISRSLASAGTELGALLHAVFDKYPPPTLEMIEHQ